jgi:predicted permease
VFDGVLAHQLSMVGVGDGETSRRTFAALISANYFSVLRVPLLTGRTFSSDEERPGSNIPVVIVSHLYWKKAGFDPDLPGKTIRINERPFTVIGITPEHFTGTMMLFGPELYFPLGVFDLLANQSEATPARSLDRNDAFQLFLVGRLKPGIAASSANAALQTLATGLEAAYPVAFKDQTLITGSLPRLSTNTNPADESQLSRIGGLLLSMAAIVLLIACLNLANMLLARGTARRKEFAIRLALGGGRGRIIRQLVTEGFILAAGGGALGLLLAIWASGLLVNSMAALMPIALFFKGATNPAVLAATVGFCTFATFFFALGPALKLTRPNVISDLKEQAGEDAPRRRSLRWLPRHPLVVIQIALSLVLLTAAGLFVRGALNAAQFKTGFETSGTLLAEVDASLGGYDQAQALQLYRQINENLATLAGVQHSSVGSLVPLGMMSISHDVRRFGLNPAPEARPATPAEGQSFQARWTSTGADYFRSVGLPILQGRAFTSVEAEVAGSPQVAIIDQVLAQKLFPEGNALGQRIQWANREAALGADASGMEIVGIVPATRWELFGREEASNIYVPFAQGYQSNVFFHVRTSARTPESQAVMLEAIRNEIRRTAPNVPLFSVKSFQQHLDSSMELWTVRAGAMLFGLFGALALLLAVVGIYGVKAYAVSRRTREIGIRMALGAEAATVQRMILREGLSMTLTGIIIGLTLGLALGQALASLLYEVSAFDPITLTLAPLILAIAAMLACWVPARRATRVSPMTALRTE